MIKYSLFCKSNQWSARVRKVNIVVDKILKFKKDLKFKLNIKYNCNIVLTDNQLIKKMNFKYRKKNKATDVLTFVSEVNIKKNNQIKLCDIFISSDMLKKYAISNKINFYDHLSHILIHSFLHINGFVHNKLNDFKKMQKIEIKILKKIGINNPYIKN